MALTLCLACLQAAELSGRQERSLEEEALHELASAGETEGRHRRSPFDCKRQDEACRGVPACCGNLVCFWEAGYNPLGTGKCMPCTDRTQLCQLDSQCCEPLVCQKGSLYDINGLCDMKRHDNSECHKDSQCTSNYCEISWRGLYNGKGGKCKRL